MYEVKTEQYAGPLEKLLELIEERELEVTAISLANVTADFISYAKTLEETAHPRVVADFIVVASRLMLIKSRFLLPGLVFTPDEEREVKDLEDRLRLYREFKSAGVSLGGIWHAGHHSFSRQFLSGAPAGFYPPKNISSKILSVAMGRLAGTLQSFAPKDVRTVKRVLVTIEEKMVELMQKFASGASQSFRAVSVGKEKSEIVALFLAVLHLLKQQKIGIAQEGQFADMIITKQ